jgi:FixJ family two-component response regulator
MLENEFIDSREGLQDVDFLRKPVTAEALLTKVSAALAARSSDVGRLC